MEIKTVICIKRIVSILSFLRVFWQFAIIEHSIDIKPFFGYTVVTLGVAFLWSEWLYDGIRNEFFDGKALFISYKTFEVFAMIWAIFLFIVLVTNTPR